MVRRTAVLLLGLLATACAPREVLWPNLGLTPPRLDAFPADFEAPLSPQTDQPMPGFGGGGGGVTRTPVIFVHGNTVSARFWWPARSHFLEQGWTPDELWAFGYGWDSVRWFDSNDLSAPAIERMVTAVTTYLSQRSGREIRQVDIVAHSLGVTAVRQWMKQNNAWHRVRVFVAVAGANHGVWTARLDARGQNRMTALELAPDSPWLAQLNRGGETPGATRYLTLYDGSGHGDVLFPAPHEHSPRLQGATNLAFNLEQASGFDHLELPRRPETVAAMADFLRAAGEPLPQATPPQIVRTPRGLRAEEGSLRCAEGSHYPGGATAATPEVELRPEVLLTCYAHSPRSGLASPMQRFESPTTSSTITPASLRAEPPAGTYATAVAVGLHSEVPGAHIVYTTSGAEPDSGSPLYTQPVAIVAPVRLRAALLLPDGTVTTAQRFDYDISLERLEAEHTLQRQLDPDAPVAFARERRKGH